MLRCKQADVLMGTFNQVGTEIALSNVEQGIKRRNTNGRVGRPWHHEHIMRRLLPDPFDQFFLALQMRVKQRIPHSRRQ